MDISIKERIELLAPKKLVGCRVSTSLSNNKTYQVWQRFMPRRNEVLHQLNSSLYSLQVYDLSYFEAFNPASAFDKWAAVEVGHFENIPEGMESINLTGGLYAVFDYKGLHTDTAIFNYIFNSWLPASLYKLDDRPHFEILGENYKNGDPDSEEEIWVPIQHKLLFSM
jgi:AraC family transcriptional regulator